MRQMQVSGALRRLHGDGLGAVSGEDVSLQADEEEAEAIHMIRGVFLRRVYAIGGEPSLVAFADCRAALDILELRHIALRGKDTTEGAADAPGRTRRSAPTLFLLGRVYPKGIRMEFPASAQPVRSPEEIIELAWGTLRYMNWFGKAW
jgi:hypothetical protein